MYTNGNRKTCSGHRLSTIFQEQYYREGRCRRKRPTCGVDHGTRLSMLPGNSGKLQLHEKRIPKKIGEVRWINNNNNNKKKTTILRRNWLLSI